MAKEILLKIVEEELNVPGLINRVLDEVAEPALQRLVAETENKFDDVLVAALYPQLEAILKQEIAKLWNKVDEIGSDASSEPGEGDELGEPV